MTGICACLCVLLLWWFGFCDFDIVLSINHQTFGAEHALEEKKKTGPALTTDDRDLCMFVCFVVVVVWFL